MQILKNEIRERIKSSALYLFAEKGYKNTTISDVASKADISVGNIYNYYPTKKHLFSEMVPTDITGIFNDLLQKKFMKHGDAEFHSSDEIIHTLVRYRYQFIILMEMCDTPEYSNIKKDIINQFITLYHHYLFKKHKRRLDIEKYNQLLSTVYSNLLNSIMAICKENRSPEIISDLMEKILAYHLSGIRRITEML